MSRREKNSPCAATRRFGRFGPGGHDREAVSPNDQTNWVDPGIGRPWWHPTASISKSAPVRQDLQPLTTLANELLVPLLTAVGVWFAAGPHFRGRGHGKAVAAARGSIFVLASHPFGFRIERSHGPTRLDRTTGLPHLSEACRESLSNQSGVKEIGDRADADGNAVRQEEHRRLALGGDLR